MNELLIQESTNNHLALGRKRRFPFGNTKPNPQIINTDELSKSIELLSKFEYDLETEKEDYIEKTCEFCQKIFHIKENKGFACKSCGSVLCHEHRINKTHNCLKKTTAIERYLLAKKVMSCKLKANKYNKRNVS